MLAYLDEALMETGNYLSCLIHNLLILHHMALTKVLPCSCQSEFQDKTYGKGMRLFNLRDDKKHPGEAFCTVCGNKISNASKK